MLDLVVLYRMVQLAFRGVLERDLLVGVLDHDEALCDPVQLILEHDHALEVDLSIKV